MFNFRPPTGLPGFRVGVAEEEPGFRIGTDGSVDPALPGASNAAVLGYDPYGNALQIAAPTAFNPVDMFYNAGGSLYPPPYRPYDPVAGRQPSQDPLPGQPDRAAKLYADVGGNPFSSSDRQGLNTNPMVPVGDGSSSPYVAYGDEAQNGPGAAPPLNPNSVRSVDMAPFALAPSSPPLYSPPSFPLGATPPPSFPGRVAPAEGPRLPLASFTYATNPLPMPGQRAPLSSLAGSAPAEGLSLADAGPADAAAPGALPASDGLGPASYRTTDPNIVRVAGGEPTVNDEVQIAQQQGTPQPKSGKDPTPGIVVVLPDGSTIPDPKSSTGQVMAPVADLQTVAAKGREAGETFREMRKNPMKRAFADAYLLAILGLNVGQGGTFDHQRSGNRLTGYTQFPYFRPIANVNVGVFAQQAGLTLEQTLDIAGLYARNFSSNADPSKPYGLDPITLHYITQGYKIGQSGVFDPIVRLENSNR